MSMTVDPDIGLGSEVVIVLHARLMSVDPAMLMLPATSDDDGVFRFLMQGFDVVPDVMISLASRVELRIEPFKDGD